MDMDDRDTGPVRDPISTGTRALGGRGTVPMGRRACPEGSPDSHLPSCPTGILARPRCLYPRPSEPPALSLPVFTPGATSKVGGQDTLSPANRQRTRVGRCTRPHLGGIPHCRGSGVRGWARIQGHGPVLPGGAGIQQRHQTTGREGRASAHLHRHAFSCTHGHAHAWTLTQAHLQMHKNVVRKGSRQGPSGPGNPGRAGGRCTQCSQSPSS